MNHHIVGPKARILVLDIWVVRKVGNISFNDALNKFYLRLYGVRHMVKDFSDGERAPRHPPPPPIVAWAPAFGGSLGFNLVSLMDNAALVMVLIFEVSQIGIDLTIILLRTN